MTLFIKSINNTQIFVNFSKRDMEYINTLNVSNMRCIHIFITDIDYNNICNNNKGLIPLIEQAKVFPKVKIIVHSFDISGQYFKKKNIRKYLHDFDKYYQLEGCSWIIFGSINEKLEIYNNRLGLQTEIINKNKPDIVTTTYDTKGRV